MIWAKASGLDPSSWYLKTLFPSFIELHRHSGLHGMLQWIILIVDDAREICSVADYSWYTSVMFLICSWCAPDMILVRSDILAALQGPVRRSGNFHPTLCSRQHSFPQSYCCSHQQKDSMVQPIVAHYRGGFTAPVTSGQIWHTSVALSCSILQLFRGAASITESNIVTAGMQFNS